MFEKLKDGVSVEYVRHHPFFNNPKPFKVLGSRAKFIHTHDKNSVCEVAYELFRYLVYLNSLCKARL